MTLMWVGCGEAHDGHHGTSAGSIAAGGEHSSAVAASGNRREITLIGSDSGLAHRGPGDSGSELATAIDLGVPAGIFHDGSSAVLTGDFEIAPLHLVPTASAHGEDARVDVELRADGALYSHGHVLGQLSGRRVLSPGGREILAVSASGVVSLNGTPTRVRLRDAGEVQLPDGRSLTVAPDGTPVAISADQRRELAPARIEGFRPELQRTALLLAMLAAMVTMPTR